VSTTSRAPSQGKLFTNLSQPRHALILPLFNESAMGITV